MWWIHGLEILGFISSVVAVILNMNKNRYCWAVWWVSCTAFAIVYYVNGLHWAMSLQLLYQVTNVMGWIKWSKELKNGMQ